MREDDSDKPYDNDGPDRLYILSGGDGRGDDENVRMTRGEQGIVQDSGCEVRAVERGHGRCADFQQGQYLYHGCFEKRRVKAYGEVWYKP